MSAQLEYDFAEAKRALLRDLDPLLLEQRPIPRKITLGALGEYLDAYLGKFILRWWFARIAKNRAAVERYSAADIEQRRKVRGMALANVANQINHRATRGNPPDNLMLQTSLLDLVACTMALWQALIDAAIIHPDAKQDYLDAAVAELAERVFGRATDIDTETRHIITR